MPFKKGNIPWNMKPKIKKVCKWCGEEFEVCPCHNYYKFCSWECYNNYQRRNRIEKICLQCEKRFYVQPSGVNRKFCSRKCFEISNRGKNNPNWRGGVKLPFGARYNDWIKAVYKRDNYKCQLCSAGQNKKNRLEAHHIYPKRKYPELVYDIDNGITLCMRCHLYFWNREESFIDFFERIRGD